jgi:uncharacterized protein
MPEGVIAQLDLNRGPSTGLPSQRSQTDLPHSLQFALFLTGLLWSVAARIAAVRAARGLTQALHAFDWQPLFREAFFLFLLAAGFCTL